MNERLHQQDDNFRAFVTRKVNPGGIYYLRVEANQPGYELELRRVALFGSGWYGKNDVFRLVQVRRFS